MSKIWRWLAAAAAVMALVAFLAALWTYRSAISITAIEAWIVSLGAFAPIGYVIVYGLATIVMVPGTPFDVLAGAVFGPVWGGILALAGGNLGAALAFVVARYVAADWVHRRSPERIQSVMHSVEREGWRFVAFVRLVPIFPYTLFNYALGLTRIPFHHYLLANLVFMAPATLGWAWLGHAGRGIVAGEGRTLTLVLVALGVVAAIVLLPRMAKRMWKDQAGPSR